MLGHRPTRWCNSPRRRQQGLATDHVAQSGADVPPEIDVDPRPQVDPVMPADPPATDPPSSVDSSIASIVESQDAQWLEGYEPATDLSPGPVQLESGEARLLLKKGTELVLSGPVQLDLLDDNRVNLTSGLVRASVPPAAVGFEVQTPGGRVVDLGTQFTVDRRPKRN